MEERLTKKREDGLYDNSSGVCDEEACKLGKLEDIEQELGIDLITLFKAKSIYIATFSYWKWNLKDKQQCKKNDIGAIEEKRIVEKNNFCIDFINKEIVIIEFELIDDGDYETEIIRLKFKDYGKTWALTREELL